VVVPAAADAAPLRVAVSSQASLASQVAGAFSGTGGNVDYEFSINGVGTVSRGANTASAPASNEKVFTTITALHALGPNFRYATLIAGTTPVVNHVLNGDLVLRGAGDPTLTKNNLLAIAKRLHKKGLHKVTGHLVVDDTRYSHATRATGWKHSFVPEESGTVDAFTVDSNEWRGTSSFIKDPTHANAGFWRKELKREHINVVGSTQIKKAPAGLHRLVKHQSEPLIDIIDAMMHESINFDAEMILRELGAHATGHGSASSGLAVIRSYATNFRLPFGTAYDGSGLSYDDRETPATIVSWLKTQPVGGDFYYSLPLSCSSGTLADRACGASIRDRIRAKTGTINHVSALSGYFETEAGDQVTFSILVSGFSDSRYAQVYKHMDKALAVVSKHG
jgi:D-alanyl-D-alanine carboxypeptidase/D-alanyl-D-alanine-endopeptidase (penicillin-binding protein 4)